MVILVVLSLLPLNMTNADNKNPNEYPPKLVKEPSGLLRLMNSFYRRLVSVLLVSGTRKKYCNHRKDVVKL
jgi:hypothetical protein